MSQPTLITVTGTVPGTGNTTGTVTFQSTVTAAHVSDDSVLLPGTWTATITGGAFSLVVPASNDPAWSPSSWTYRVRIRTTSSSDVFDCVVPYNAPGGTIGISQLTPVPASSGDLYVTTAGLTSALAAYETTAALTSTLAGYVTGTALTSTLAGYETTSALNTTLAGYVTNSTLTSTLANYETTAALNTTLAGYVTSAGLTSTLAGYETTAALNSTLANYSTTAQMNTAIAAANTTQVVNVRDAAYGAKGDGTTDDTTAITAAITALGTAGGGTLFFPRGTYVTTGIVVRSLSNFTVLGERGAALVMAGNTVAKPNQASGNLITVADCTDFSVEGVTLDGRRDTIAPLKSLAANALAGQPSVQVANGAAAAYVVGQRLQVCGGLTANGGADVDKQDKQMVIASITPGVGGANDVITFTGNLANAYTAGGSVVSDAFGPQACNGAYVTPWQTGDQTVAGRHLTEEDQQQGLHLINCHRFRVAGCVVRGVWESPIRMGTHLLDGTAQNDGCSDGTITGNLLYHGYDQGVGVWLSTKVTVADNVMISTGWAGVSMTLSDYCTVVGNTIDSAAQPIPTDSKSGHGIAVEGGAGNTIANNVILNSRGRGLYLTAGGTFPFGGPAQYATSINGSDNVALPSATVNVADASGLAAAGSITVLSSAGAQQIVYTGKTGNQLTGCSGGVGTLFNGQRAVQYGVFLANGATLQLGSTSTTVSDGTKFQVGGRYSIIDGPRTERIDVTGVAGNVITLANPTKFRHFDKMQIGAAVAEGNLIIGNSVAVTGDAGIALASAVGTVIKGNRLDKTGLRGVDMVIWLSGGVQPPCNTLIEGNSISAPDTTADGAGYQAIGAQQVTDFQVIGNRCGGALGTAGYFQAIGALGCSNFLIERNAVSEAYANGIRIDATQDWVSQLGRVAGNQLSRCYGEALLLWGGRNLTIEGNIITGSAANNGPGGFGGALNVRGVKNSIFSGNQVIDNGRGVGIDDASINGVATTTTGCKFVQNIVTDSGHNFDPFSGASTQQNFGFKELGGSPSGNQYVDNVVSGNQSNWTINSAGNTLRGNTNYNPVGRFSGQPAVPASGTPYTNVLNADAMVTVSGGTVTGVAIGGQATGLTGGSFRVPAGQSITLTYSVAPTWTWFGD